MPAFHSSLVAGLSSSLPPVMVDDVPELVQVLSVLPDRRRAQGRRYRFRGSIEGVDRGRLRWGNLLCCGGSMDR